MNIAHILPTAFMGIVAHHKYHMALCHIAVEDPKYLDWFKRRRAEGSHVILDNGAWEGNLVPFSETVETAVRMNATTLVLPDYLRDGGYTLRMVQDSISDPLMNKLEDAGVAVAAVVQGSNRQEVLHCFTELCHIDAVQMIMLPKLLDDVWGYGGRFAAFNYLKHTGRLCKDKIYWLLGLWTDPVEVYLHAKNHPEIVGMDTALAFHAGYQDTLLSDVAKGDRTKPSRPGDYFSIKRTLSPQQIFNVRSNIALLDNYAEGHG